MNEIELRHQFHQIAELSCFEKNTHSLILKKLQECHPSQIFTFTDNYNILAEFKFSNMGKTVLLRADFDALAINEVNDIPYKSENAGVSHKCGHDGHTVILLTVAKYLHQNPLQTGTVLLLFQCGEEIGAGMQKFMNEGIIKNYNIDYAFALHNIPGEHRSSVICREESFTCSVISLEIGLFGSSSHAAEPQKGISPLPAAMEITRKILSENHYNLVDDTYQIATLIEMHIGKPAFGVSPGEGVLRFTIRAKRDHILQQFIKYIDAMVATVVAQTPKLSYTIHQLEYFAACNNHIDAVEKIFKSADNQHLTYIHKKVPFTWGEDFGLMTQKYCGALFGFGAGEDCYPLHHESYDFPDDLIIPAANMFLDLLHQILDPNNEKKTMKRYSTIIWDWNGTLIDDVEISINSINPLLSERHLPLLEIARYKDIFCFPVQKYYELLGFDFNKEPFSIPANAYMNNYRKARMDAHLSKNCVETLQYLQSQGFKQIVLSAMEQNLLAQMLKEYQIYAYFDAVFGLCDDYAVEKKSLGKKMIESTAIDPASSIMIGDTLHDAEVAKHCGFDCILYSGGHLSADRLKSANLPIINNLDELKDIICPI